MGLILAHFTMFSCFRFETDLISAFTNLTSLARIGFLPLPSFCFFFVLSTSLPMTNRPSRIVSHAACDELHPIVACAESESQSLLANMSTTMARTASWVNDLDMCRNI